ncbi:ABC transporter permease [Terribacillus saccharophilus]|uniref:Branched-chain amino acid ABC transporter permease n=1 Tax=Terribacillus saccharophilus TaxID=361277 RepID=A0ABX4H253_9BACI|nr:ABC transporter permease [Terribacillus saccharophilus]PAD36856.1 branched-chain amino acid ABC transporter permease [Terribacillus saccharophilus]PAD97839.1 branched-chain amino acid ABC transporter permease [Terribacillus saccharophilus]PAE01221.1 branched-chain amino acid ABC transporter permease [Terribacillus saccharophilus]
MEIKTENLDLEKKNPLALFYQFRELGLFFFIVILCIGVQLRNPSFLTGENILDMATNTSILVILALGMMIVLITRGIDLSIGAVIALSGMLTAQLVAANPTVNPFLCLLIGTIIGALCGMVIGLLVAKVGLLPIIATLALMNIFRGLTFLVSDGEWVSSYQMSESFVEIATGTFLGLNHLIWIAVIFCLVFFYFLNYTRTGRQIYAVGSNPQSAAVSGIKQGRILFLVYTIMGGLSGLCGVLWVSKFASAQGDTASGYELTVIAACILGGVSIAGGSGKLAGVLLGAILLGILNNALPLLNVSPFWQNGIQGFIILLAVIVNAIVKRRVERIHLLRRAG